MIVTFKIALGYLIKNKRQSLYTIVSIALSSLLVTFLCTSLATAIRCSGSISVGINGSAHGFLTVPPQKAADVAHNAAFEEADIYESIAFDGLEEHLPQSIIAIDSDDFQLGDYYRSRIIEGRFPENDGEIMLPLQSGYSVGESVSYSSATDLQSKEFAVCGLINDFSTIISIDNDFFESCGGISEVMVSVRFRLCSEKLTDVICDVTDEYDIPRGDCFFVENRSITRAELVGSEARFFLAKVIAAIIITIFLLLLCCRMMINCSFAITFRRSLNQFGILKTTGISSPHLIAVVFLQSSLLALVGIIPGISGGLTLSAALYRRIVNSDEFSEALRSLNVDFGRVSDFYIYYPLIRLIAVAILMWSVLSAVGTAREVIRRYPAETLLGENGNASFTPSRRFGLIKRFGGCAGKIAVQSRHVNRRQSKAAVISIVMSVTLAGIFSSGMMLFRDGKVFTNSVIYMIILKTISCFLAIFITLCAVNTANIIFADIYSRRREIALMRALGMSELQLLCTVLIECALCVFTAIVVSALLSALACALLYAIIFNSPLLNPIYLLAAVKSVLLAGLGAAAMTSICAVIPLRRIGHDNITEQMRMQ